MTESSLPKSQQDITSLIQQLSNVQNDREKLSQQLDILNKEISLLKADKREEMKKVFENVIAKWIEASVHDENTRKQFHDGMERVIENGKETGMWRVAIEASAHHAKQIEQIEQLRQENEQLKTNNSGQFQQENNRKRKNDEVSKNDFWAGFD